MQRKIINHKESNESERIHRGQNAVSSEKQS